MRKFFYLIFLLAPLAGMAQSGHYFLSHFSPKDETHDPVCFDMAQGGNGVLYFATRSGVLAFDGRSWQRVTDRGAAYALETDQNGDVYWAGANGFGRLSVSRPGVEEGEVPAAYHMRNLYQVAAVKDQVYLMNDDTVFAYNPRSQTVTALQGYDGETSFTALFTVFGNAYVSTVGDGVFRLNGTTLQESVWNKKEKLDVLFSSAFEDRYLIGTTDDRLFICREDMRLTAISLAENDHLKASLMVGASWISRELVAIATLRGGVIFIHPETGRIVETVDYQAGLPDNEIYSLLADGNRNIWVSHDYGVTRIAPFLPFRSFNHYDGLKGNILCARTFDGELYVGTSLGLFHLERESQVALFANNARAPEPQASVGSEGKTETQPSSAGERGNKRKGFFRFLKRKRDKTSVPKDAGTPVAGMPGRSPERDRSPAVIMRQAQYAYKKVKGIDGKVTQLELAGTRLLASGVSGVYEIKKNAASAISRDPVRYVYAGADNLVVCTYDDQVGIFSHKGGRWVFTSALPAMEEQIGFAFTGESGTVWLCGTQHVYPLTISRGQPRLGNRIPLDNPGFSKTIGVYQEGKPVVANVHGFFTIDNVGDEAHPITRLPKPGDYFPLPNSIWFHNGHAWEALGDTASAGDLSMLNLCQDIRFIGAPDDGGNFWIIDGKNELYKFFANRLTVHRTRYPVYLKSVTQGDHLLSLTNIRAEQDKGVLSFDVVQPGFADGLSTEYRYRLKGLDDKWSEWSRNHNRITVPYLPAGKYTLMVETKDVFGVVQELTPVDFRVEPPYWKTPWFYAMELTLFTLLVWLSFKLSFRYRFISRLLSLLTIILLIEFIQTIAGYSFSTESSPIVDFMIQVAIAFVILPVEGYLRNLMFRSMGSNSRLYQVINEMDKLEKHRK